MSDFLRLRALEQAASPQELEDAEDKAALADWRPGHRRADLLCVARRGAAATRPGRVSRQVIWEALAIDQAAGFLRDDPAGVGEMLDAVARLADEPRPAALPRRQRQCSFVARRQPNRHGCSRREAAGPWQSALGASDRS